MGMGGAAIVGAGGFVGAHLVRGFEARGVRVVPVVRAVDDRTPTAAMVLGDAAPEVAALRGVEVVVHAAGTGAADPAAERGGDLELLEQAMRLAEAARAARFVLVSTVAVYGFPFRLPITEAHPYAPRTARAAARVEVEMRARRMVRELGIDLVIARPARVYGPGDTGGFLEGLASMIRSGAYRVVGDGNNVLHHIHVDDVVEGIWSASNRDEAAGEHFILAGPETTTLAELSERVARAVGRTLPRRRVPTGVARAFATVVDVATSRGILTPREPPLYHAKLDELTLPQCFDTSKARRLLGFLPRVGYEEGIARTLRGDWPALARAGATP